MNKKALSLPILISLVMGNMIGTGIYMLPASLAAFGTISLFSWLYTALGAIFLALTITHLTRRFPKTGGPYIYCKEAFGQLTGFLVAYIYWLSILVSIAALSVASVGYLGFIFPILNSNATTYHPIFTLTIELAIVWFFTLINLIGLHTAGVVQLILTILKVAPLLLIALIGLGSIHIDNLLAFNLTSQSNFHAIGGAAALTFWAFVGLESATVPAENTKGYKDIYIATIIGTVATALIYILTTFVLLGMIPATELQHSQFPFADAATQLFGPYGALLITLCAVISALGSLNVCILMQGQIVFAAARDHLFPKRFATLSKHDVPVAAQLLTAILASIFLVLTTDPSLLKQFNNIALLATLLTLITYLATVVAELKFIFNANNKSFMPIFGNKSFFIALCASAYCIWTILNFNIPFLWGALGTILLAIPIYFFVIKKQLLA